jgi:short-subunit dehydrogenase
MNFLNQVIVITGASSGIGRQLATEFAARGAIVVGCGRSITKLKEALKEVRRSSPRSTMIGCDVSDAEQVRGMMKKILADYGQIDILVNNAGVGMRKPFVDTSIEMVEQIISARFTAPMKRCHR